MPLSPADIVQQLGLQPHPTCGYTNEIYRSALEVP
jgi:predicted cupin superfamily sugar epimerase